MTFRYIWRLISFADDKNVCVCDFGGVSVMESTLGVGKHMEKPCMTCLANPSASMDEVVIHGITDLV